MRKESAQVLERGGAAITGEPRTPSQWRALLNSFLAPLRIGDTTLEVVFHGYSANHPDNLPHRHSFFEVCLVVRGHGKFIVEGQDHSVSAGDVFIARPGVRHQIVSTCDPRMELYWIAYQLHNSVDSQSHSTERLLRQFAYSSMLVVPDDGRCRALWLAMRALAENGDMAGLSNQQSWMSCSLIVAIAQLTVLGDSRPVYRENLGTTLIRQALRYIDDNLEQPLTLRNVSEHVGLSERHFSRLFKEHTGSTFVDYLNRMRVDHAAVRLRETDEPIKEIAMEVGYQDVHYFSRVFRRMRGMAPGKFRRSGLSVHP